MVNNEANDLDNIRRHYFPTAEPGKELSAHSPTPLYNQILDVLAKRSIHSHPINLDYLLTDYEASDRSANSAPIDSVRAPALAPDDDWWNTQLDFAGGDSHTAFPKPYTLQKDANASGADQRAVYEAGGGDQAGNMPVCWDHGCNGRVFSSWSNLRRHQRERRGMSPKSLCPLCGAFFSRTTARNQHLANMSCGRIRRYSNGRDRPSLLKMQQASSRACLAADEAISGVCGFG
ncbi:hypothetical protein G3M48_006462 [Beauveria asiatica]|uniref:C2H2-type domain-containing protein n=1 Tax=Beauveria asiatica TaxID=1069075 RepID=A0AAW0S5L8_9HYPO